MALEETAQQFVSMAGGPPKRSNAKILRRAPSKLLLLGLVFLTTVAQSNARAQGERLTLGSSKRFSSNGGRHVG